MNVHELDDSCKIKDDFNLAVFVPSITKSIYYTLNEINQNDEKEFGFHNIHVDYI